MSIIKIASENFITNNRANRAAELMKNALPVKDVNMKDENGDTALIWAAYHKNLEVAKLLIEAKADPNVTNNHGHSALKFALQNNHTEMVLLLNGGVHPINHDDLVHAFRTNNTVDALNLLNKGANLNHVDSNGISLEDYASRKNNKVLLAYLGVDRKKQT